MSSNGDIRCVKILFVWSGLNGYMGYCWRELSKCEGIEVKIVVDTANKYFGGHFNPSIVLNGLEWYDNLEDVGNLNLDVVFIVGWRNRICRKASVMKWGGAKKVCCFDMPWEWSMRKIAARFVLWRYLRNFDAAFVPGQSAKVYARWLGFKCECIFTGLYSTTLGRFCNHIGGAGFLFVGRRAKEKGIDILEKAFLRYKAMGGTWRLEIVSGVSPDVIGDVYAKADCLILPSIFEPWGVVLLEAAAAGIPIICTDKCGARYEVFDGNGFVVKAGSVAKLADVMLKISCMADECRREMGVRGRILSEEYSCENWTRRVISISESLTRK